MSYYPPSNALSRATPAPPTFARQSISTIGTIGASTEQNNGFGMTPGGPYPTQSSVADYGYMTYMQYRLGWKAPRYTRQEGVSGDNTTQVLARLPRILASSGQPDAWLYGSYNDFGNGAPSLAQSLANTQQILDLIRASGSTLIIQTAQPRGAAARAAAGLVDADYYLRQSTYNAFLRQYAIVNNVLLNDVERIVTVGLTGEWKTGYSGDDLHPYKRGALAIGTELATLLTPFVNRTDDGPCSGKDPLNLLGGDLAFMNGTIGQTTPPSTWTVGNANASYGESRTPTWSQTLAARADGLGNQWTVTLTAPGAIVLYSYAPTGFAGQAFDAQVEVNSNGTWATNNVYDFGLYVSPYLSSQQGAFLTQPSHAVGDFAAAPKRVLPDLGSGVLRTAPIQRDGSAPGAAFTMIAVTLWGETGAAVTLSRARVRQVG